MSYADNFCKQFWPRSGPTKCPAWSGSNLFETQMVFLKEFSEKVDFEEKSAYDKKSMNNFPFFRSLKHLILYKHAVKNNSDKKFNS